MRIKKCLFLVVYAFIFSVSPAWGSAFDSHKDENDGCLKYHHPITSFIEFQSINLETQPPSPITIKGKLKLPVRYSKRFECYLPKKSVPAVVILHGSAGIDFRGDFYARSLNANGIATLEIDMWEARGVKTLADRPSIPIVNLPDAFGALRFLTEQENIDPEHIGIMGFSWGGVVTMAAATEFNAARFGGDLRFAAHIAHYPVCFAYNSAIPGSEFFNLTGAPIMIQIGDEDDYDEGAAACLAVKASLTPEEQDLLRVRVYKGATHGWDRLQMPTTFIDPFSHLGAGGEVSVVPDVNYAYKSRRRVVRFFRSHLME